MTKRNVEDQESLGNTRISTPKDACLEKTVKIGPLSIARPDWWEVIKDQRNEKRIVLTNPNGYQLAIEFVEYRQKPYLKIGHSTYIVTGDTKGVAPVDLATINAIGNRSWFQFYNRNYSHTLHNTDFFLDSEDRHADKMLRLFPVNRTLHPALAPKRIPHDILYEKRMNLLRILGSNGLHNIEEDDLKRIKYDFFDLINYITILAIHGDSQDYYDSQNVLTALIQWLRDKKLREIIPFDLLQPKVVKSSKIRSLLLNLKEYLLLCRTGANWDKWKNLSKRLSCAKASTVQTDQSTDRTRTIFEREVASSRLCISAKLIAQDAANENPRNWKVVRVDALGKRDLDPLAAKSDIQEADKLEKGIHPTRQQATTERDAIGKYLTIKRRATVYGVGETLIGNAIIVSLAFAGGSATTVKKILGRNKLVHLALKVRTNQRKAKWISLLHARAGMILGQNPHSKIVFVTNVEGPIAGESESSTLEFLNTEYSHELKQGQIYNVNQRSGFLLDPQTGQALRYKDGHLAIVAENHLWAFFALLLNKNKVIDIIQNTTGIISLGNGDNILNYPREGMLGEIEYARRWEGRAVATVAIAALSAGDKKGGFAARVTYRNGETGAEFQQTEMREISEFPTRGKSGFSAVDIADEASSEFYQQATQNRWFIEDIFKNPDGTEKQVAFNVAFYAVDLRLIISRIFELNENDRDLVRQLREINDQEWVDKITAVGEAVPAIEHVDKGAPNENGSEEVKGYMTEQMVQDFIVNALALLKTPDGLPEPEVVIRLCERKDFFLPYKGKSQYQLDEEGNPITDTTTGNVVENYDLIANQKRYAGVIRDHLNDGHQLVLGPNEHITEIIPVDNLDIVKKVNKGITAQDRIPFQRKMDEK